MPRRTCALLLFFCTFGLTATHATAQEAVAAQELKRLTIEELAQLDVTTVSRRSEPLAQVAGAVSVLRGEEIRRAGVTTLVDALRLIDGVEVARADGSTWAVSTRGFDITTANKLLVLIDGRTVYSPLFAGTFWSVQDVPLADIDRIEVTRGPGGTIWGANAVNGVVNVITKSASETRGGSLLVVAGTEERAIATAQYGGRRSAFDYRVYGKFRLRDENVFTSGVGVDDGMKSAQTGFRAESNGQGRDSWLLQGDMYVAREGLFDRPDTKEDGGNVLGRWTRRFSPSSEFRAQMYYDRVFRLVANQLRDERDTFDVDVQHHFVSGRHDLIVGGGYRVSRGDDKGNIAFFFDPQVAVTTIGGLFAQDEYSIVPDRFAVIFGSKFERNTFTGFEPQPSLRVRWTPSPRETIWAAVSRAVRLPTRFDTDLHFTNPVTGAITLQGSRDFETEKVIAYEAGYRMQLHQRVSVDVATYLNGYDDLRSQELPPVPGPVLLRNMLNSRTYGVDVAATALLAGTWRVHTSYSYLHERFTFDPSSTDPTHGFFEFNDPTHMFKIRTGADFRHGIEADGSFRYISALPHPVIPGYAELDTRIGWRPQPSWDLSLIGQNLLHDHHPEFQLSSPTRVEFERGLLVRATWRF
jgi:iron complex outermembrane receptor protein